MARAQDATATIPDAMPPKDPERVRRMELELLLAKHLQDALDRPTPPRKVAKVNDAAVDLRAILGDPHFRERYIYRWLSGGAPREGRVLEAAVLWIARRCSLQVDSSLFREIDTLAAPMAGNPPASDRPTPTRGGGR